jgi:hypothetical protein
VAWEDSSNSSGRKILRRQFFIAPVHPYKVSIITSNEQDYWIEGEFLEDKGTGNKKLQRRGDTYQTLHLRASAGNIARKA